MDFQKSKVLLKKINALHDSAEAFDSKFSKLEKDLVLQYVRDLYEVFVVEDISPQAASAIAITAPTVVETVKTVQEIKPPVTVSEPAQVAVVESPVVHVPDIDPALAELFVTNEEDDVSSKFALKPLSDIAMGMGINDRILMINALFSGDQQNFKSIVTKLNSLPSFDQAKDFLATDIAASNNWVEDSKIETAKRFIKLVRRRYI